MTWWVNTVVIGELLAGTEEAFDEMAVPSRSVADSASVAPRRVKELPRIAFLIPGELEWRLRPTSDLNHSIRIASGPVSEFCAFHPRPRGGYTLTPSTNTSITPAGIPAWLLG